MNNLTSYKKSRMGILCFYCIVIDVAFSAEIVNDRAISRCVRVLSSSFQVLSREPYAFNVRTLNRKMSAVASSRRLETAERMLDTLAHGLPSVVGRVEY